MDTKYIINTLKEFTGISIRETNKTIVGSGSIDKAYCLTHTTGDQYPEFYNKAKKSLESIPWESEVRNPYHPKESEYPTEEGYYITMLDCDEHAVDINRFSNGHFCLYDRTHVKWWMKLPKDIKYFMNKQ